MTEKDTASMTTVQMKADYAASEVYSTASEPPPVRIIDFCLIKETTKFILFEKYQTGVKNFRRHFNLFS